MWKFADLHSTLQRIGLATPSNLHVPTMLPPARFEAVHESLVAHRLAGLGAEAADAALGIVAGKCRQVDAGDRPAEPRRLMVLLDGPAARKGLGAAFDGRAVGLYRAEPCHIQRQARVARLDRLRQVHLRGVGLRVGRGVCVSLM